jgi:hypothetical protein
MGPSPGCRGIYREERNSAPDGVAFGKGERETSKGTSAMSFRKRVPKPHVVFDDPNAHFDFLTLSSDVDFEGQHFDRKEACRARPDGNVAPSDLRKLGEQITECISAFSNKNRDGGLLVLGIGSSGEVRGLAHLSEAQVNAMTRLDTKLVHHRCESKLVEVTNAEGQPDHIALVYAHYVDNARSYPSGWCRNCG